MLWLNPGNPDTFPPGLIESLNLHTTLNIQIDQKHPEGNLPRRLQREMKTIALQPNPLEVDMEPGIGNDFTEDTLEEIQQFFHLQVRGLIIFSLHVLFSSVRRPRIGSNWLFPIFATITLTAFGAVLNMTTRTTWRITAQDLMKKLMISSLQCMFATDTAGANAYDSTMYTKYVYTQQI